MAASRIDNRFRRRGVARFIERASIGRRFENCAVGFCQRRGWRVVKRNWHFGWGEIDLLVRDRLGKYFVVEVRGVRKAGRLPRNFLTQKKLQRLENLGKVFQQTTKKKVNVVLVEILGIPPKSTVMAKLSGWFPHAFGLKVNTVPIFASPQI